MASTTSTITPLSLSSSSTSTLLIDAPPPRPRPQSQCCGGLGLSSSPLPIARLTKTTTYCRKFARSVIAMATGEAPVATVDVVATTVETSEKATETPPEISTETPEIVKTIQQAWEKIDDKYAVTSLAAAGVVALWGSAGMISAIDRLPLVPGVLELVGIGYTGWFAYKNLLNQPDREALIEKVKNTYKDITGT